MGTNRAHRDSPEAVINDVINGPPIGAVNLLVLSINNFLNNEIKLTVDQNPPQSSLLFMGVHSAALTIAEVLFRDRGKIGYKKFLENFVDGDIEDKRFSLIASEIHAWRNILVHGWLSLRGHKMEYDYDMQQGFEERMSTLYINPKIYLESYLNAFNKNGRIAQYIRNMSKEDFAVAQHIIKQKYTR